MLCANSLIPERPVLLSGWAGSIPPSLASVRYCGSKVEFEHMEDLPTRQVTIWPLVTRERFAEMSGLDEEIRRQ